MAILQLRCLGGFELRCDDQPLPKPATIKSQSLLVYLAFHRQTPFHRDQLAALFWGDRPEDQARRSLSTALWHIRSCLPDPELILSDAETVRFDPGKTALVDADAFVSQASSDSIDQLRSAIALYRG